MRAELVPGKGTSQERVRRSDRIEIAISVEAFGTDLARCRAFFQSGETMLVSRHGGALILNYAFATGQELTIRCLSTNEEAEATVVGLMSGPWKHLVYGVAFVNPEANPWGIEFPTLTGSDDGLARLLLGCPLCSSQKVVHLNEIELQVFDSNQAIQQFCSACSETTSWRRLTNHSLPNPDEQVKSSESAAKTANPVDRRRHGRVKSNILACIRQTGFPEETVACENISRGGISCRASKAYPKGTKIEVAIPYSPGNGNIFVPAEVLRVQKSGNYFRVGIAYRKTSERPYQGSPARAV
jgi:hypothetical protein